MFCILKKTVRETAPSRTLRAPGAAAAKVGEGGGDPTCRDRADVNALLARRS